MQFPRSFRLIGAVLALLATAACADDLPTGPSTVTNVPGPRFDVSAAAAGAPLVSGTGAGCLSVQGGSTSSAVAVTLASCVSGAAAQTWTLAAVGSPGLASVGSAGTVCLDAWGGSGAVGTTLGTWTCVPSAPNHQWTLGSDGTLKGQNGLCATASTAGGAITLQPCSGAAAQKWTLGASSTAPAPAPSPTPTTGTPLVNAAGAGCLAVANGSTSSAVAVTLASCVSGAAAQTWTLAAVGSPGLASVGSAGTVCLDAWGGSGAVGTTLGTWTCVPSAPNHQWTLGSDGTLKGQNGLCATASTAGGSVTLQPCTGASTQRWSTSGSSTPSPPSTPSTPSTGTLPTTRFTATLTGVGSGLCLSVQNNTATQGIAGVLASCQALSGQLWSLAGLGATGVASTFGGAQCLDAWGGSGAVGTQVGTWGCVASASNHQWTLASDGTVRGQNGLCLGVRQGAASSGSPVELQACTGAGHQKWTATVVAEAPSTPTPVAPTAPSLSGPAAVLALMGTSVPSVASIEARGGAWARYESDFRTFAERHWTSEGADNYNANYYDRAMIYYVWWARTGNATYLDRANQLAVNHRTYLEGTNYQPQPHNLMLDGVALHAILTGDQRSAYVVGRIADTFAGPQSYWLGWIGDRAASGIESRIQARILSAALLAWYIRVPSPGGVDYAAQARVVLTRILGTQAADGAYRWPDQCGYEKPFMAGMLNDALIRYYTTFEPDARIPGAVKKSVDYLWANDWVASVGGFKYMDAACAGEAPDAVADLNGLIVSGFGFVAKQTGDAGYYAKGDAIFTGGVNGAWLFGTKQFNQEYTSSYRYLGLRF